VIHISADLVSHECGHSKFLLLNFRYRRAEWPSLEP